MKNKASVKRVAGGPDCGKLRVSVEFYLGELEELRVAQALGCHDEALKNIKHKATRRSVGPVGEGIAKIAVNSVWDLIDLGMKQLTERLQKQCESGKGSQDEAPKKG